MIAPDGALADGLDTAACILGPERGLKLIESTPGAAALFVRIAPGRRRDRRVEGWAAYKTKPPGPDPERRSRSPREPVGGGLNSPRGFLQWAF